MHLVHRSLFGSTLLLLSCAIKTGQKIERPSASIETRPNIVFIMADDLGYECLGCDGGLDYQTPRLDALAAGGMRFENAHSNPVCTPTRVQVMTGLYTQRNYDCFGYLRPSELTFANLLTAAGYATCIAGKWQLSGNGATVRDFGFDAHCLWNMHSYRVDESARTAGEPKGWMRRYDEPTLYVNGEWVEHEEGAYGPRICLDFILDFISEERTSPFFVYYPMILPHNPFKPTPDSSDPSSDNKKDNFVDMVRYVDRIVGELVDHLTELGLREETLIIFTGDNGTNAQIESLTAAGPVRGAKSQTLDAGTHVPLVANWPGVIPQGQVSQALVDFTDFLPTFAELAQTVLPTERAFDGHSLVEHLRDAKPHPRESIYCYYPKKGRDLQSITRFARNRRWKLYGDGRLFDVIADPLETQAWPAPQSEGASLVNTSDMQEAAAARSQLRNVLDELR